MCYIFFMKRQYEKLIVWKEAHKLCLMAYRLTANFPGDEKFALVKQIRKSSYGIPMNIAEGNGRRSKKEKIHFLDIAIGSMEELHYQLVLSKDLEYIAQKIFEEFDDQTQRTGYLLQQLRNSFTSSASSETSASSSFS